MASTNRTPVLFLRKEECCGCSACYAICPQNAIAMKEDEEGFEYPLIDSKKCVGCGLCIQVCQINMGSDPSKGRTE